MLYTSMYQQRYVDISQHSVSDLVPVHFYAIPIHVLHFKFPKFVYMYLYREDDFCHHCLRAQSKPLVYLGKQLTSSMVALGNYVRPYSVSGVYPTIYSGNSFKVGVAMTAVAAGVEDVVVKDCCTRRYNSKVRRIRFVNSTV